MVFGAKQAAIINLNQRWQKGMVLFDFITLSFKSIRLMLTYKSNLPVLVGNDPRQRGKFVLD